MKKVGNVWEKSKKLYIVYYPPRGRLLEEIQYLEKVENLAETLKILYIVYFPPGGAY